MTSNETLQRAKLGDSEAISQLLENYKPLLLATLERCLRLDVERDEAWQELCLVLLSAIKTYQKDKGAFPAYAKRGMQYTVINYARKAKKAALEVIDDYDQMEAPEAALDTKMEIDNLKVYLKCLTDRQRRVVRMTMAGMDSSVIAQRLKTKERYVREHLRDAIAAIRKCATESGF